MSLIPLWARALILLAIAGAIVAAEMWWHHDGVVQGRAEVQAAWNAEKLATATENAEKIAIVTAAATDLQTKADKERGTLNAHIRSIDLEHSEQLRRLQNRPSRPAESASGMPPNPGPGTDRPGSTGAGLYKPDGEFLAGEAARGKLLAVHLASCEADYKRAQNTVNSVGSAP